MPPPRPTAPDLNFATFTLAKPVKAGYVRFFIDSVQGDTQRAPRSADIEVFGPGATRSRPRPVTPSRLHRLGHDRRAQPRCR